MSIRTRKLKTGGRAYDVLMRRPDGSQFSRSFRTRRDAETWQAQQKADMSRRCWHDPTAAAVEFREYAEEWLRNRVNLRPRTVAVYRSQLRCHIIPAFGGRSLISITKRDVRSWHADLSRRKSPMVAAKSYRLLATIMNTAVDDDLLPGTPCRLRGAGSEGSAERPLMSIDEAYALADAIEPRFRAFILLAAFCGLRLGELLGLTRADVDLLHRKLSVTKQRQEVDGGIQITLPKTAAGVRSVGIPAAIVGDLEAHLATWAEHGPARSVLRRASRRRPPGLVLHGVGGGQEGHRAARRHPAPRPPPPRQHPGRPGPGHHEQRPHGPHGPPLIAGRPPLPPRQRSRRPGDLRRHRRRHPPEPTAGGHRVPHGLTPSTLGVLSKVDPGGLATRSVVDQSMPYCRGRPVDILERRAPGTIEMHKG
jgi:integrase